LERSASPARRRAVQRRRRGDPGRGGDAGAFAVEKRARVPGDRRAQGHARAEKVYLEDEIRTEYNFEEIIGQSSALKRVLHQVETVAPTDSAVLIGGETGTGKELRSRAPFTS